MRTHRLRREIIATQWANDLVNRSGPSFVDRINDITRAGPVTVACAWEASRRIFDLEALVDRINALDNQVAATAQTALHQRVGGALRRATLYLARNAGFDRENPPSILDVVALYREPVDAQRDTLMDDLSAIERQRVAIRRKELIDLGAPDGLANETALLSPLTLSLDVADLSRNTGWPINSAATLHCVVGAEFGLDVLRDAATTIKLEQHWDRLVVRRSAQDFGDMQVRLAEAAARAIGQPGKDADMASMTIAARNWIGSLGQPAQRVLSAYSELNEQGQWTFAKLMLMSAELNGLIASVH
jgi:glutamate dehydrogenase